jgi:hypothetical protein
MEFKLARHSSELKPLDIKNIATRPIMVKYGKDVFNFETLLGIKETDGVFFVKHTNDSALAGSEDFEELTAVSTDCFEI